MSSSRHSLTLRSAGGDRFADEDATEVRETAREEARNKSRKYRGRTIGAESRVPDEKEVDRTFFLSRPNGWVINRKPGECLFMLRLKFITVLLT